MTRPSTLDQLLRISTVRAPAPEVERLRATARARRRRRRSVAALVLVAVVGLTGALAVRLTGPVDRVETIDGPTTSTSLSTSLPTSLPSSPSTSPATSVDAGPDPGTGSESLDGDALDPPILVPPGDWELRHFGSLTVPIPHDTVSLVTEAGELGPAAWMRYNPGLGTVHYADGPSIDHDTTSPRGRPVLIGHDGNPDQLTAIFLAPGGSVAISSFDVAEDELLTLVDAVAVVDGGLRIDAGTLPTGWRVETPTTDGLRLGPSYSLQLDPSTTVSVRVEQRRHTLDDLSAIRHWPDIHETTIDGNRTLLVQGDNGPLGWTAALILADDWTYAVELPPWDEDDRPASVEEMEALVRSLRPIGRAELLERAPWLHDRSALLDRWFGDVELPASVDLAWMYQGPPLALGESERYYQIMTCAIALDWAASGDPTTLDRLEGSEGWAVAQDLIEDWTDRAAGRQDTGIERMIEEFLIDRADIEAARAAGGPDERMATALVQACQWSSQLTGQAWVDHPVGPEG